MNYGYQKHTNKSTVTVVAHGTQEYGGHTYRLALTESGGRYVAIADLAQPLGSTADAVTKRARRAFGAHRALVRFPTSGGEQTIGSLNIVCLRDFLGGLKEADAICAAIKECVLVAVSSPATHDSGPHDEDAAKDYQRPLAVMAIPFDRGHMFVVERDGAEWVLVRPVAEAIGLDAEIQRQYIERQSWATPGVWASKILVQLPGVDTQRRAYFAIHRRRFAMWMATLNQDLVDSRFRPTLAKYQDEASDALDAYFNRGVAVNPRAMPDEVRAEVERLLSAGLAPVAGKVEALEGRVAKKANATDVVRRDEYERWKQDALHVRTLHECRGHDAEIGPSGGKRIKDTLMKVADLLTPLDVKPGDRETATKARRRVRTGNRSVADTRLRKKLGFFGTGTAWSNLKASRLFDANDELGQMLAEAERVAEQHKRAQSELFN